jgi:hypothetical protein
MQITDQPEEVHVPVQYQGFTGPFLFTVGIPSTRTHTLKHDREALPGAQYCFAKLQALLGLYLLPGWSTLGSFSRSDEQHVRRRRHVGLCTGLYWRAPIPTFATP